jgi:hypothetical protein
MRLWSIHPSYLDAKGLVALWREALLAQKVILGKTRGYRNHPQLMRFRNTANPVGAIAGYLRCIADEADKRGYNFKKSKIVNRRYTGLLPVTDGQLEFEFKHLLNKLKTRDPELFRRLQMTKRIRIHPLFKRIAGDVEDWERV